MYCEGFARLVQLTPTMAALAHPCMPPLSAFRSRWSQPPRRGAVFLPGLRPRGATARSGRLTTFFVPDRPVGEDIAQAQVLGQFQQGHLVPQDGPDPLVLPASQVEGGGAQAAVQFRPRQPRLPLEPVETLREIAGEVVVSLPWCVRCRGIEPVLQEDGGKALFLGGTARPSSA